MLTKFGPITVLIFYLTLSVAPLVPEPARSPGFFLLPSPFEKGDDPLVLRKLIAAPVMDRDKILQHGASLEVKSGTGLLQRMNDFSREFCEVDPKNRENWLKSAENEMERDHLFWQNTLHRFDRMLDHWLEDRLESSPLIQQRQKKGVSLFSKNGRSFLVESELSRARDAHTAATELMQNRQELIRSTWEELFEDLFDLSDSSREDCVAGINLDSGLLPNERLYEPLYLARYEFLSILPDGVRMEFILLLNRE